MAGHAFPHTTQAKLKVATSRARPLASTGKDPANLTAETGEKEASAGDTRWWVIKDIPCMSTHTCVGHTHFQFPRLHSVSDMQP